MKFFIVSDTHDNIDAVKRFLDVLKSSFISSGFLIHLGDIVSPFTLKLISESLPPKFNLKVVLGNNDGDKVLLSRIAKEVYDQPEEADLCGLKAFLLHGFKSVELTEKIAYGVACGGYYDVVLYGHTHRFKIEKIRNSYLINPGTLSGYLASRKTYGIIDCEDLTASITDLESGERILSTKITAGR
ncbi:MAG: metallophosphoesterase [Sulfolobales archaeon]|nr:metallophosphoesterase [Sulfolobales archaeon]MDW8010863.1 metallophosphoesterase [Sulfolobales archaeon]